VGFCGFSFILSLPETERPVIGAIRQKELGGMMSSSFKNTKCHVLNYIIRMYSLLPKKIHLFCWKAFWKNKLDKKKTRPESGLKIFG